MKHIYQLYCGPYLQWQREFASDIEAVNAALETMKDELGWRVIRLHTVISM